MAEEARSTEQRIADARRRLEEDADLWIATAADGSPWLIPLSFHWTGEAIVMATLRESPTYRNVAGRGGARLALGLTRDVVLVDGQVDLPDTLPEADADATARASGYDPRTEPETAYLRVTPERIQAWRNVAELKGRTIMRGGRWADGS
jgi:hypothetical protein